jgi:formylglycine-generating enzyme required for sulfatase activity
VDYELRDSRFNDGVLHLDKIESRRPNPWGLLNMHGNVAEWTRSAYAPFPYANADRQENTLYRTVRGGSWYDRPKRATSSFRLDYPAWQRVYNVGFRVVVEE